MKLFEVILAIALILVAIYNFDFYNLNRTIIAIILFIQAVTLLSSNEKLKDRLRNILVVLGLFLLIRIIFGY